MIPPRPPVTVLVAEDDDEDFLLLKLACEKAGLTNPLRRARDGAELMDFLRRRGSHQGPLPWPLLVLLDLRMPKKDGWEALGELRSDPALRRVPVLILTTSKGDEDVARGYELGANAYFTKPAEAAQRLALVQALRSHWLELAELPPRPP